MSEEKRIIDREPRGLDTREASARDEAESTYTPPSLLPDPEPNDTWAYRWVRLATYGQADSNNAWQRRREGWEAVAPSEMPEIANMLNIPKGHSQIVVGGLVLCRAPHARMTARDRYYHQQNLAQVKGLDSQMMKEQDPRMPLLAPERSTRVTTGRG